MDRDKILHEAGRAFATKLDVGDVAETISRLAVPGIADWCAILARAGDRLELLGVAHVDAKKAELVRAYVASRPLSVDDQTGSGSVVRTGKPITAFDIPADALRRAAIDAAHLKVIEALNPRSSIVVPLRARDRSIGALALGHSEGGRRFVEADVAFVEDFAFFAAAAVDAAQLYRAERDARSLLSALTESAPDGVYFQGADGRTAFFNARLLEIWGIDASVPGRDTLEERLSAVAEKVADPAALGELAREMEREPDRSVRVDVAAKDGRVFDCITSPVVASDGRRLGRAWYYRDVTAQRTMERELALAQRQAVESEKLAAIGSLVSGVAHEIRTPLTYVQTHAHLLALKPGDPRVAAEAVKAIEEGVGRINQLVAELRRFARNEPPSEVAEANLDDAARSAALLFQATSRGRVHVETALKSRVRVPLAPQQIEQILLNLLENGAEASPPGGRVRVTTRAARTEAEIRVVDEGRGIPAEIRTRIFEPFFTTKRDGLGLGLSIVRRLVEGAGGGVTVEAAQGSGAVVVVRLPVLATRSQNVGSGPTP